MLTGFEAVNYQFAPNGGGPNILLGNSANFLSTEFAEEGYRILNVTCFYSAASIYAAEEYLKTIFTSLAVIPSVTRSADFVGQAYIEGRGDFSIGSLVKYDYKDTLYTTPVSTINNIIPISVKARETGFRAFEFDVQFLEFTSFLTIKNYTKATFFKTPDETQMGTQYTNLSTERISDGIDSVTLEGIYTSYSSIVSYSGGPLEFEQYIMDLREALGVVDPITETINDVTYVKNSAGNLGTIRRKDWNDSLVYSLDNCMPISVDGDNQGSPSGKFRVKFLRISAANQGPSAAEIDYKATFYRSGSIAIGNGPSLLATKYIGAGLTTVSIVAEHTEDNQVDFENYVTSLTASLDPIDLTKITKYKLNTEIIDESIVGEIRRYSNLSVLQYTLANCFPTSVVGSQKEGKGSIKVEFTMYTNTLPSDTNLKFIRNTSSGGADIDLGNRAGWITFSYLSPGIMKASCTCFYEASRTETFEQFTEQIIANLNVITPVIHSRVRGKGIIVQTNQDGADLRGTLERYENLGSSGIYYDVDDVYPIAISGFQNNGYKYGSFTAEFIFEF